jgi:TetR/AcrR family transcriptional regulator, fatty acid metabolism regulator protein
MSTAARPQSLKEKQRQERERLILRAAGELLVERGYHETSIDEIAARVGISKGTVYLHFASKEDLVVALFEHGQQVFLQQFDVILNSSQSPSEKLRAIIEWVYSSMSNRRFELFGVLRQNPELFSRFAEKHSRHEGFMEEPRARLAAVLEEGKAAGELDPTMPTAVMLNMFEGLLLPRGYRRLIVEEHMSADEIIKEVCRFFFKGVAPDASETRQGNGVKRV